MVDETESKPWENQYSQNPAINVDRKCDNCGCKAVRIVGLMVPHADEDRTYLCDDCWTLSAVLLELED